MSEIAEIIVESEFDPAGQVLYNFSHVELSTLKIVKSHSSHSPLGPPTSNRTTSHCSIGNLSQSAYNLEPSSSL